jgi:hypothetical protein
MTHFQEACFVDRINGSLHRFAASGAEGITMNFLFIVEHQFRAEKSLLSDSTYNELLIINLATVRAERNSISPPAASRKPL